MNPNNKLPKFVNSLTSCNEHGLEEKLANMKLNAEAQEWYPANHRVNLEVNLAALAATPASGGSGVRYSAQSRLVQIRGGPKPLDINADLQHLQAITTSMTSDPGQFGEVIDDFMQTLNPYLREHEMMTKICEHIFCSAIEEASFRYNAARLCALLQEDSHLFKQHLEGLIIREVEKNRQRHGFTLFLAEVYMQSKFQNWKLLYDALNKLLTLGGDENIKTVCQTLKLAGNCLESFNKHKMQDLISLLVEKKVSVQKKVNTLIEAVVSLQSNKWGYTTVTSNSSQPNPYLNTVPSDYSASMFCLDGEELTVDERAFLDAESGDIEDPDGLYNPEPEMDEEIQAAFREFVNMSK